MAIIESTESLCIHSGVSCNRCQLEISNLRAAIKENGKCNGCNGTGKITVKGADGNDWRISHLACSGTGYQSWVDPKWVKEGGV